MQVNLIAAVGKSGQLGLEGRMPWHDSEDLRFFRAMTVGRVVIVGMATYLKLPELPNRIVLVDNPMITPEAFLAHVRADHDPSEVWVAGGAKTYARYMHLVRRSFVTHVDYDGEADTYFPPLFRVREVA